MTNKWACRVHGAAVCPSRNFGDRCATALGLVLPHAHSRCSHASTRGLSGPRWSAGSALIEITFVRLAIRAERCGQRERFRLMGYSWPQLHGR